MPPGAGVEAGRKRPGGLGLDAREVGAMLSRAENGLCGGESCRGLRLRLVASAQRQLVVDRASHVARRVSPLTVVLVDPGGHSGAGGGFSGEVVQGAAARRSAANAMPRSRRCPEARPTHLRRPDHRDRHRLIPARSRPPRTLSWGQFTPGRGLVRLTGGRDRTESKRRRGRYPRYFHAGTASCGDTGG